MDRWSSIDEADPRWAVVREMLGPRALHMEFTHATAIELNAASWLSMTATSYHGYPQPENGYKAATYDLAEYCAACGVGGTQRAPFRFRRDPALRANRLLQLNWIFDVFFTTPDTWQRVFQPLGVSCREVVLHRTGAALPSVVQLDAQEAPAYLALVGHPRQICERCGQAKHLPFTRGFLPPFSGAAPAGHMALSRELFGDGARAYRKVLVSAALYRAMREAKLRGVSFLPTEQPASIAANAR